MRKTRKLKIQKRLSRKNQEGGKKWRSGADTCIFKPFVKCLAGEPQFQPQTETSLSLFDYISRIVEKDDPAVRVEPFLKKRFPHLVQDNLILVAEHICTPGFSNDDLKINSENKTSSSKEKLQDSPCSDITKQTASNYVNLITRFFTGNSLFEFEKVYERENGSFTKEKYLSMIESPLGTVITLVPDKGPWVIHTDLHKGNILCDLRQISEGTMVDMAISDWGRCIIIDNPENIDSIFQGIELYFNFLRIESFKQIIDLGWIDTHLAEPVLEKLHFHYSIVKASQLKKDSFAKGLLKDSLKRLQMVLRGWMVYSILSLYFKKFQITNHNNFEIHSLLVCDDQEMLIKAVNRFILSELGNDSLKFSSMQMLNPINGESFFEPILYLGPTQEELNRREKNQLLMQQKKITNEYKRNYLLQVKNDLIEWTKLVTGCVLANAYNSFEQREQSRLEFISKNTLLKRRDPLTRWETYKEYDTYACSKEQIKRDLLNKHLVNITHEDFKNIIANIEFPINTIIDKITERIKWLENEIMRTPGRIDTFRISSLAKRKAQLKIELENLKDGFFDLKTAAQDTSLYELEYPANWKNLK